MVSRIGRSGFTLAEALIALSISSVLIILVGSVFLTQNNFYSHVLLRSQVQENARAVTELVASDVRSLAPGGIILADSTRLVVRAPMATALICGRQGGSDVMVHVSGGLASIDTNEVGGYGYRAPALGPITITPGRSCMPRVAILLFGVLSMEPTCQGPGPSSSG